MTDFASIIEGGFSNIVENADKFMEYPGQSKLNNVKELGQGYSAASAMGYSSVNDLDLSEFTGSEQTKITNVFTNMDTMSSNTLSCSELVQGMINNAIDGFMNTASILDAFKSQNGITDCTYGMETLFASEQHLDTYFDTADTSVVGPAYTRLSNNSLSSSRDRTNFLADIEILDGVWNLMDGACEILKNAFLALVDIGVSILNAATFWLSNFGLLGRLTSDPCVTNLIPDEASGYMGDIGNEITGTTPVLEDLTSPVTSLIAETPISTPTITRPWINPNTVTNAAIGNTNRSLYNTVSNKIDSFNPITTVSESTYSAATSTYGSSAATVPSTSYSRTSLSYNETTGRWE